jgi:hypothetical protein
MTLYQVEKPQNLRELGSFDIQQVKNFSKNISEEEWEKWNYRQKKYKLNKYTSTFPLIWSDPGDFVNFPNGIDTFLMNKESNLHEYVKAYYEFLETFYDGTVIRSLLVRLKEFSTISPHVDLTDTLTKVHRCHLPIITNKKIMFCIQNNFYHLEEGKFYEVNNSGVHSVTNDSDKGRVHLMIDILPNKFNMKIRKIIH